MAGLDAQIASGEALKRALVDAPVERLDELEDACRLWHDHNSTVAPGVKIFAEPPPTPTRPRPPTDDERLSDLRTALAQRLELLRYVAHQEATLERPMNTHRAGGQDVFVVHGRDSVVHEVARVLRQMTGREPVILRERANQGLTVIEKFERHAGAAGAAVVILTPDDEGRLRDEPTGEPRPRARQNVVYELGWFHGRLGRGKVVALLSGDVERPSDISGVLYVEMDDGNWKFELGRELQAAGIHIDFNGLS